MPRDMATEVEHPVFRMLLESQKGSTRRWLMRFDVFRTYDAWTADPAGAKSTG